MTSKEDIALQLTLKSIERISPAVGSEFDGSKEYNEKFANYVADFYNTIYDKIQTHRQ